MYTLHKFLDMVLAHSGHCWLLSTGSTFESDLPYTKYSNLRVVRRKIITRHSRDDLHQRVGTLELVEELVELLQGELGVHGLTLVALI